MPLVVQAQGFRPDERTATITAAGFRRCVPRSRVFVMTCPFVRWCAPIFSGGPADVKLVFSARWAADMPGAYAASANGHSTGNRGGTSIAGRMPWRGTARHRGKGTP